MSASARPATPLLCCSTSCSALRAHRLKLGFPRPAGPPALVQIHTVSGGSGELGAVVRSEELLRPVMAAEELRVGTGFVYREEQAMAVGGEAQPAGLGSGVAPVVEAVCDCSTDDGSNGAPSGTIHPVMSTVGRSTNIVWHECPVGKPERQKILGQKGCVIWITGLSGSGKSTLACTLSRKLHCRGHLSYVLDGDNIRHGLNKDLSFEPEDRAENIRRIGEVAKLFADAGVMCIASLISPYRRDREACRALLPEATFIEVFLDMPLEVCEERDAKGLYKLARAGKIEGFTGIDDPYEPPLNCEILIKQKDGVCPSPADMADQVISYLETNSYLQA